MTADLNGGTYNPDLAKDLKLVTLPRRKPRNVASVRLSYFDDCDQAVSKKWIMKGLFARGETSSWIAPPGAGKSAVLTCAAVYLAAGMDWRGFRIKERCGVLYLAFERADLVNRRLAAYKKKGFANLPIAVGREMIDLMASSCVDIILETIREAEAHLGIKIGVVIIDTYAKGIAFGGGDEDKAKDQGKCLAHLRRVQETTDVHIAIIGHTGKDESRGARGSNAHVADTDAQVQINASGEVKTAKVVKANDQPCGTLLQFTMVSEPLGTDEDGDEITVGILSDDEISGAPVKTRWPKGLTQLFDAITNASIDGGIDHQVGGHGPTVRAAYLETVRSIYRKNYPALADAKRPYETADKALSRALKDAKDSHLIGSEPVAGKQLVWLAT
jgi:AAA domain-containing protein